MILGAGHSGTTIFHKMLAMHPDATWFSQYSQRTGQIEGWARLPLHNRIDQALRRVFKHGWEKEPYRVWRRKFLKRAFIPRPHEALRIWSHLIPVEGSTGASVSVARIRAVIEQECRLWDKRFFVSKPLLFYRHVQHIHAAFPTTRFVHLVRDGRAVALSLKSKFQRSGGTDEEALMASAERWVDEITHVRKLSEAGAAVLELRYEDMCADVHDAIRRVLEFSGMDPAAFQYERCPRTLTPTNHRWLEAANPEELKLLSSLQRHYLEQYGYLALSR
jgi:hypothetical protein